MEKSLLFADHARRAVKLTLLVFAFAQVASAALTNRYVVKTNAAALAPYDNWTNAAPDIQTAINYAYGGETVLVAGATYDLGGVTNYPPGTILTNRVAIYKAITVRSANNDPANTIIKGAWNPATTNGWGATRCVYMTNGSALIGFMLTNGATLTTNESGVVDDRNGGAITCRQSTPRPTISNCVIAGNAAANGGGGSIYGNFYNCTLSGNAAVYGGGIYAGTDSDLYNCTLSGNSASISGGGSYYGVMYNCLIVSNIAFTGTGGGVTYGTLYNCLIAYNTAANGGGVQSATLYNCTVVSNSATNYCAGARSSGLFNSIVYFNAGPGGNWQVSSFTNSCTTPTTTVWAVGNITNDPMFVNKDTGDFHPVKDSPVVNAGTNYIWMTDAGDARSKDLDAHSRIDRFSRQVDMGCYEYLHSGVLFNVP